MVGAPADVQSLHRRDGSDLEAFDCPNPARGDYGLQHFKVVCMTDHDINDCEDINLGGAKGTIIRLPPECGPDEWVRVVSFTRLEKYSTDHLPSHLSERAPQQPKVYEIHYDYNFSQRRQEDSVIFIRVDSSVHPGYWNAVVKSDPEPGTNPTSQAGTKRDIDRPNWRDGHLQWFEDHGYVPGKVRKRTYGSVEWWKDIFNTLIKYRWSYGIHKKWTYKQVLYHASKKCPPNFEASITASVGGTWDTSVDFGFSAIGTLYSTSIQLPEIRSYFRLESMRLHSEIELQGAATLQVQSQKIPIIEKFDPIGGAYNIKGLWILGPYVGVDAQMQALATISGRVAGGYEMRTQNEFIWMFPEEMDTKPSHDHNDIKGDPFLDRVTAGPTVKAHAGVGGSVTLSVFPKIGFQAELDFGSRQLIHSSVEAEFEAGLTLNVGFDSDCPGILYSVDATAGASINSQNTVYEIFDYNASSVWQRQSREIHQSECLHFEEEASAVGARSMSPGLETLKRSSHQDTDKATQKLAARSNDPLFPDITADLLSCPDDFNTPTGDCNASVADDDDELAFRRRDQPDVGLKLGKGYQTPANAAIIELFERGEVNLGIWDKPAYYICQGQSAQSLVVGINYPSAGLLVKKSLSQCSHIRNP